MEIKSIETKYVAQNPFAGLTVADDFVPHYHTTIRYTDPREGERAERVYGAHGDGESEFAAEQSAMENLKGDLAAKAYTAMEKYDVAHGAGNLDIA